MSFELDFILYDNVKKSLAKCLHLLFPSFFPRILSAVGAKQKQTSKAARSKICQRN